MTNEAANLLSSLRLSRSRGIGPVTYVQLIRRYGSAAAALEALPDLMARKGAKGRIEIAPLDAAREELAAVEKMGARLMALGDPDYPASLLAIADPPPVLTMLGNAELLTPPAVAIVGPRNASAAGRRLATALAADLGSVGYVITSGLARGIDGAAHEAALLTGTIAVLAGGADNIYPPQHTDLYHEIRQRGLIVSEMRLGHTATARDFPKRNRIVSGLSKGVIVVEAADRSGTLITARMALEQGREVFAVPGSPLDPRAAGTNRLIRQGATLIRHGDDVLEVLSKMQSVPPLQGSFFEEAGDDLDEDDRSSLLREVEGLLSPTPVHRDELLRMSSASPAQLADILLELILSGVAEELPGGMFALSAPSS